MPPRDLIPSANRAEFETALLRFINDVLPTLDRRGRSWSRVDAETPLFASGLLDSLSILHLIAQVEQLTGCAVPDHLVVMKHFRTARAIATTFWKPTTV